MLTAHRATMQVLTIVERMGYQTCRTNMVALTSRTNVQSTEMVRLNVFNLSHLSASSLDHCTRDTHDWDQTNGILGSGW